MTNLTEIRRIRRKRADNIEMEYPLKRRVLNYLIANSDSAGYVKIPYYLIQDEFCMRNEYFNRIIEELRRAGIISVLHSSSGSGISYQVTLGC